MERKWNAIGTRVEREWNVNGTRMERKWNANGTHLRTRSGRVPNAFSVRLFLSSTVYRRRLVWMFNICFFNFLGKTCTAGVSFLNCVKTLKCEAEQINLNKHWVELIYNLNFLKTESCMARQFTLSVNSLLALSFQKNPQTFQVKFYFKSKLTKCNLRDTLTVSIS
jgi:hypothetical protein